MSYRYDLNHLSKKLTEKVRGNNFNQFLNWVLIS